MLTEKKCRGNGVASGHGCGKLVPVSLYGSANRKYGIGISCGCYSKWLKTPEGQKKVFAATLKVTKPRRDLEQAFAEKKNRNKITDLIRAVVDICHKYIRERDKGKPCIACGTPWMSTFQASHFYKAELYPTIKLNENNIHGGCMECNLRKEGNLSEYQVRLPNRIGKVNFDELNRLAELDHSINHKWDREELKKTRKYYQEKLKELKNQ